MLGYENTEIFNYMTKNRKLKLEEYDDNGNLIEVRELDDEDLFTLCMHNTNAYKATKFARKEDLDEFNKEELEIIDKVFDTKVYDCYCREKSIPFYWFDKETVGWFKEFFKTYNQNEIKFALEMIHYSDGRKFNVSPKSPYFGKELNLLTVLKFIRERDGFYYAVNNKGERTYDFVDKPTKKQVKYQRTKNGNRCIFLNFKDWEEYLVTEDELK